MSLLVLATFAIAGCTADEEFSTDPGYQLVLSHDTISVDTVLVSVKSSTREFRIYNPNKVGIRFSATLAGGTSSCFAMNIDGRSASSITDLEILPGDSLFGFINITPQQSHIQTGSPLTILRDSIMLVLESGLTGYIQLNATVQNATFLKNRTITCDTTFTSALPYVIYDTLRVARGSTLTIKPGTTLLFHDKAGLDIQGRVIAQGSQDQRITLRTDRLDRLFSSLPYDLLAGQWGGIDISRDSYGNLFDYCDIHGAAHGIKADTASADQLKFSLTNSIIHNIEGECIKAMNCSIKVANSQITNAKSYCVDIWGGIADFEFCTLANCYLWSINSGAVRIADNIEGEQTIPVRARFNSCILTAMGSWGLTTDFRMNASDTIGLASDCMVMNSLVLMRDTTAVRSENTVFENENSERYGYSNFVPRAENSYASVFQLDSLSAARGIACNTLLKRWPKDLAGTDRPLTKASAGCYEFIPKN